jgi:hypothetical protein
MIGLKMPSSGQLRTVRHKDSTRSSCLMVVVMGLKGNAGAW